MATPQPSSAPLIPPPLPTEHDLTKVAIRRTYTVRRKLDNLRCSGQGWKPSNNTLGGSLEPKWSTAIGFAKSADGSGGVIFVGFPGNKAVVLKGSSTVISDSYAHKIAELVNLPVPKHRLIWLYKGSEYEEIETMFEQLEQKNNVIVKGMYRTMTDMPIIFLMELAPGVTIDELKKNELTVETSWGKKALEDMGKLLAYDVLINNWDRFPFLWRADAGNPGNFLFIRGNEETPVVAIDQSVTSLSVDLAENNYQEYLDKIHSLLDELVNIEFNEDPSKCHAPIITSIFSFLADVTLDRVVYGVQELRTLTKGLLEGFIAIAENITKEKLDAIYKELETEVDALIERMSTGIDVNSKYGLTKVSTEFLMDIVKLLQDRSPQLKKKLQSL